jgi:hypothetical protein
VFETLADKLQASLGELRSRGRLDDEAISRAMREIRLALLEADVNFRVVKEFVSRVRERAAGEDVGKSLTPGQQVVKIVHDELTALMGAGASKLAFAGRPPTIMLLAGLQAVPDELYEAARVDGANAFREFFAVTLPGLRNEVLVAFVLTTINALRSFDIVYNTTAGGPGNTTIVPSMYMYQNAFLYNKVGYAAAVATILALAIFVLAAIVLRVGDRGERA